MRSYARIYCSNSVALSGWPTLQEANDAENGRMAFWLQVLVPEIITNLLISWVLQASGSPYVQLIENGVWVWSVAVPNTAALSEWEFNHSFL